MIKPFKILTIILTIGVASAANASSVYVPPVTITETYNELTHIGSYSVTNNSSDEIFAFALGNDVAFDATTTYRSHWAAQTLTQAEWTQGVYLGGTYTNWAGGIGINSSDIPFQNLFPGYTKANLYKMADDVNILPGETTGYQFFYSASLPASPFVVLFNNGGISTGQATVVPLPSAFMLFATGLLGLMRFKRR